MFTFVRVSVWCFFLFICATAQAQEIPPPTKPLTAVTPVAKPTETPRAKIGVALEGGGALGLAHIGVLKWFEENHIPIDYVAGTSMGGLVGGLYATGKSPAELRKLMHDINWDDVLRGRVPF